MMKLKYMVHEPDEAAKKLIANWDLEVGEIHFFRASSNYVYIYKVGEIWRFARFSRVEERDLATLEAELEFLIYLKEQGYPVVSPLPSKSGNFIETVQDEIGKYHGLVFERAPGVEVDYNERTPEQFKAWGEGLGRLHNLAREFRPKKLRPCYEDWMDKFESAFIRWDERAALGELRCVRRELAGLPKTQENFGLVHYDFQYDNTFWNQEEKRFYIIDFDDAHYHFYAQDLLTALADLEEEGPENHGICREAFIEGYSSVSSFDQDSWAHRDIFQRYSNLMTFYRILYSMEDSDFGGDPDWLAKARPRWIKKCNVLREGFKNE